MSGKHSGVKTPIAKICAYWSGVWGIDAPADTCWGCYQRLPISRAHVVARMDGGKDEPANLLLACRTCNMTIDGIVKLSSAGAAIDWCRSVCTSRDAKIPAVMLPTIWGAYEASPERQAISPIEAMPLFVDAYKLRCRLRLPFGGKSVRGFDY